MNRTARADKSKRMIPYTATIICPVFNAEAYVQRLVETLLENRKDHWSTHIVFVDNGSEDSTKGILQKYDEIELLDQTAVKSSYAARNTGVRNARGKIIAFIDADCLPEPDWLLNGIRCLQETNADMVAGRVNFSFDRKSGGFRTFDAITHIDTRRYVASGRAPTANLFVKRSLFNRVGEFPEHVRSGGDLLWTSHAVAKGAKLTYCDKAVVWHPTRGRAASIQKALRVGTGFAERTEFMGQTLPRSLVSLLYVLQGMVPPVGLMLYRRFREKCSDFGLHVFARVYLAAYATRMAHAVGVLMKWSGWIPDWLR